MQINQSVDNKVKIPGIGSAIVLFVVAALGQFDVAVSPELASASTGLLAFIIGWFSTR